MSELTQGIIEILYEVMAISPAETKLDAETDLLGSVPEFDSTVVLSLLTALEETYGIRIEDDDLEAELFANVGSLARFVQQKQNTG